MPRAKTKPPFLYTAKVVMGNEIYWGGVSLTPGKEMTAKLTATPFASDSPQQDFSFYGVKCDKGERPWRVNVVTTVGKSTVCQTLLRGRGERNLTPLCHPTTVTDRHIAPWQALMQVTLYPKYHLEEVLDRALGK